MQQACKVKTFGRVDVVQWADIHHHCDKEHSYVKSLTHTPESLLDFVCEDEMFTEVAPKIRAYVASYGNCITKNNVWSIAMHPLVCAALNYVILCENKWIAEQRDKQESVVQCAVGEDAPRAVPARVCIMVDFAPCPCWEIGSVVRECLAFAEIGAACRGTSNCIRGGVTMTPEGFSSVLKCVVGPEWRACEIPPDGRRCAMVISNGLAHMFNKCTGELLNAPLELELSQPGPRSTKPSVFECSYNALTDSIRVIDCSICNGENVALSPLTRRLAKAAEYLSKWKVLPHGKPIAVIPYTPPTALIRPETAKMVLFVKEADPYTLYKNPHVVLGGEKSPHGGCSAYLWKQPSLNALESQAVLICRVGEAMAVGAYGECALVSAGGCCSSIPTHMGAYVCEYSRDLGAWRIIRAAKRSERLYTADEANTCSEGGVVNTQITRAGMIRLLKQICPTAPAVSHPERQTFVAAAPRKGAGRQAPPPVGQRIEKKSMAKPTTTKQANRP